MKGALAFAALLGLMPSQAGSVDGGSGWSQESILAAVEQVIVEAAESLPHSIGTRDAPESARGIAESPVAWGLGLCRLSSNEFWRLHVTTSPSKISQEISQASDQFRAAIVEQLESDAPEGAVYGSVGQPFPVLAAGLEEELVARANLDQVLHNVLWQMVGEADDLSDDRSVRALLVNRLLCSTQADNSDFLYRTTLERGFPGRAVAGGSGENAAILIAKHTIDESRLGMLVVHAAFAAGAGDIGSTNFGYLLDTWTIATTGRQAVGSYIDCQDGAPYIHPPILDLRASARLREALHMPSEERLLSLATRSCSPAVDGQ